jgi:hypothetical protein
MITIYALVLAASTVIFPKSSTLKPDINEKIRIAQLNNKPLVGTYYGLGSLYNASWVQIAKNGNRYCIRVVSGPPTYPWNQSYDITVSSLTPVGKGVYRIDGLNHNITFSKDYKYFDGIARGRWVHRENSFYKFGSMPECLSGMGKFKDQLTRKTPPQLK